MNDRDGSLTRLLGALTTIATPTAAAHFAVPDGGLTILPAHLTLFGFGVGVLALVIVYMFGLYRASMEAQIAELTRLAERGTKVTEVAVEKLAEEKQAARSRGTG